MWYVGYIPYSLAPEEEQQCVQFECEFDIDASIAQDEEGNYKIPIDEVNTIKQELIGLMIACPSTIQVQLGDAISIIADSDFWVRWDTLVPDLVSRLSPDNFKINNGVLEVAHSIFVRWRPLFRSDDLYTEINHVLSTFAVPFLSLLNASKSLPPTPQIPSH